MLNFITSRPLLKGILIGVGASAAAFYLYKRHEDKVDSFLRDQGFDVGCGCDGEPPVGYFCGTGMHGGRMFLRCDTPPADLPKQVICTVASNEDKQYIRPYIEEYAAEFGLNADELLSSNFFMLVPDTKNPYKQLYTHC